MSAPNAKGRITIIIAVNSMTLWIWIGGGLMAIGTIIAIGPTVRRKIRPGVRAPEPTEPPTEPVREEVGV